MIEVKIEPHHLDAGAIKLAIEPHHLDGIAALIAAGKTAMCKRKGERDTEFVKRIVCAYLNAHAALHPDIVK